jgi:hypothetical protein
MTTLAFSTYVPVGDLARILAAVLVVALVAPSAASLAIVGFDRRRTGAALTGNAFIGLGAGVLMLLVGLGIYALIKR